MIFKKRRVSLKFVLIMGGIFAICLTVAVTFSIYLNLVRNIRWTKAQSTATELIYSSAIQAKNILPGLLIPEAAGGNVLYLQSIAEQEHLASAELTKHPASHSNLCEKTSPVGQYCLSMDGSSVVTFFPITMNDKVFTYLKKVKVLGNVSNIKSFQQSMISVMAVTALALIGFSAFILFIINNYFRRPLEQLDRKLIPVLEGKAKEIDLNLGFEEMQSVGTKLSHLIAEYSARQNAAVFGAVARQVAHDIRSPLSALNMILYTLKDVPEEKRLIIRNVAQRINDIANDLIQKSSKGLIPTTQVDKITKPTVRDPTMLMGLLDSIISEKRLQFRERSEIEIRGDLTGGYDLFAEINASEFSRAISNLINNSIEASSSVITIELSATQNSARLVVKDNGKGIPEQVLSRIGQRGLSYGKDVSLSGSGSGLGIYHAKKCVEEAEGRLQIESQVGQGTTVSIYLPKAKQPVWFAEQILIPQGAAVVAVDDDLTVHQIWQRRLSDASTSESNVSFKSFLDPIQFESWAKNNYNNKTWLLVDYEFIGRTKTGLDIVDDLRSAGNIMLVTSRFDEMAIRERVLKLGIKMIPKSLAPFIPIKLG